MMNFITETRNQAVGAASDGIYGWRQMAQHGRI